MKQIPVTCFNYGLTEEEPRRVGTVLVIHFEKEIDRLVYQLYGFTEEELDFIIRSVCRFARRRTTTSNIVWAMSETDTRFIYKNCQLFCTLFIFLLTLCLRFTCETGTCHLFHSDNPHRVNYRIKSIIVKWINLGL